MGELDLSTASELAAAMDGARGHDLVLVDLSKCEFIDSTGIAVILEACRSLEAEGKRLGMVGAQGQVLRILSLTGLESQGLLFVDEAAAVSAG